MTDTFAPPVFPNVGSSRDVKARVLTAQFGDGYSQRAPDGLNAVGKTLTIEWQKLTKAQAQEIEDFFVARGGATAFFYQPPKESAPLKWTCAAWRRVSQSNTAESLSATFDQVYDL